MPHKTSGQFPHCIWILYDFQNIRNAALQDCSGTYLWNRAESSTPARKYRPVARIFLPRFFRNLRNRFGSVSWLFPGENPSKLKNSFFPKKKCTASPAAIPHRMQEISRTARAVPPNAVLYSISWGFSRILLIIKAASQCPAFPAWKKTPRSESSRTCTEAMPFPEGWPG